MNKRNVLSMFVVSLALFVGACATGGSASSSAPVELDGSKWKMVAIGGQLDGRVIQFKKKGSDGYIGTLTEMGRRLEGVVGAQVGMQIFSLRQMKPNEYEGVYSSIEPNGNKREVEVSLSVAGDNISWNQETAVWERLQ
jgi:hypothetical protein